MPFHRYPWRQPEAHRREFSPAPTWRILGSDEWAFWVGRRWYFNPQMWGDVVAKMPDRLRVIAWYGYAEARVEEEG